MVLSPGDGDGQLIEHGQPAHAHSGVVEHNQQNAGTEQDLGQQVAFARNMGGVREPTEIQGQQPGPEQERSHPDSSEAKANKFNGCDESNQSARQFDAKAESFYIRKVQRAHGGPNQSHPPDRNGQC